jgi:hypothetical protein
VADPALVARLAGLARVATVAAVAGVARVAEVARVAVPGTGASLASGAAGAADPALPRPVLARTALAAAIDPDARTGREAQTSGHSPNDGGGASAGNDGASAGDRLAAAMLRAMEAGMTGRVAGDPSSPAAAAERTAGGSAVDRIAHVLDIRDAAAARPLSSVLLRLDQPDGSEDRVRVDLRGSAVGATFDVHDPVGADDLSRHVADLTRALEVRGLETDAVTVRAARSREVAPAPLLTGLDREPTRGASMPASGSQFTGRDPRHPPRHDDPNNGDTPRQRPRRGSRGDT